MKMLLSILVSFCSELSLNKQLPKMDTKSWPVPFLDSLSLWEYRPQDGATMAKLVFFLSHAIFQETSPNLEVFIVIDHRNGIKMVKTLQLNQEPHLGFWPYFYGLWDCRP